MEWGRYPMGGVGFHVQGRRFTFFDKEVVKDPETGQAFDGFKVRTTPPLLFWSATAACGSGGYSSIGVPLERAVLRWRMPRSLCSAAATPAPLSGAKVAFGR